MDVRALEQWECSLATQAANQTFLIKMLSFYLGKKCWPDSSMPINTGGCQTYEKADFQAKVSLHD